MHGLLRVARAGGVREERDALGDVVEDVLLLLRVGAAHGERDDLRARVFDRRADEVERVLARAEDKAGGEGLSAECECVSFVCHFCFLEFP